MRMNDGRTISCVINVKIALCADTIMKIIKMTGDMSEWTSQIVPVSLDPVPVDDDTDDRKFPPDGCNCCDDSNGIKVPLLLHCPVLLDRYNKFKQ